MCWSKMPNRKADLPLNETSGLFTGDNGADKRELRLPVERYGRGRLVAGDLTTPRPTYRPEPAPTTPTLLALANLQQRPATQRPTPRRSQGERAPAAAPTADTRDELHGPDGPDDPDDGNLAAPGPCRNRPTLRQRHHHQQRHR
jgi:hypothetical protein